MNVLDLFLRGLARRITVCLLIRVAAGIAVSLQFASSVQAQANCVIAVPVNTVATLDLASCMPGGFVPTGVTVVVPASHGTVTASGTTVTYTPARNYFGPDSFSYFGTDAGGPSPQDTVSVTVTGRPDPSLDTSATGVVLAQIATAQRFSRAQISNIQRRMETLHRPPGAIETKSGALQGSAEGDLAISSVVGPGLASANGGTGLNVPPLAGSALSLIRSRAAVDMAGIGTALGLNTTPNMTGSMSYWIDGVANFGIRDASAARASSEFSSSGISIGVDRRVNDQMTVGMAAGYARDKTKIGSDGTTDKASGYSLSVYGSYLPSSNTYLDGLLGIGSLDFASRRFVLPANDFALGKRNGKQFFGSLTGGYELRDKNTLISPYARLDFSMDRLASSSETGAGLFALTYFGQRVTSLRSALGIRAESAHAASFGYAVPRLRAELQRGFWGTGRGSLGYADPGGPTAGLVTMREGRDAIMLGLGSEFLLRDGLTLSLEYQLTHSFANNSSYGLLLRLSKDFDAKGMPKLTLTEIERNEDTIDLQFDAGATRDDNVTRAKAGPDRLRDDLYGFHLGGSKPYGLTDTSRILFTGTLGGQKFHRFNGLSNLQASVEAEYQYRESSEFSEPTYAAFARYTLEDYESRLRDGYQFSAGVSVRLPLTDRIGTSAAFSHNVRNARSQVFSTRDNSVRGNVDYALTNRESIYLGSELRVGDIISSGRPSLENVTIAKVFAQDDAFAGGQLFAYKVDGRTWLTTIGYNLGFGTRDSVDFSWRHVRSTPSLRPAFVTSPRSYKANQLSAVYLLRF